MAAYPPQRRRLKFEHLEGKTSPTATVFDALCVPSVPAEVSAQASPTRFLEYVSAMFDGVQIDRDIPSSAEASSADQLLAAESPPHVD